MASTSNRALLANYLLGQQSSAMGKNYISNPSAFMNTVGTSVTGTATVSRNTTSPLTAISDFSISLPNNATDYVAFSTDTFDSSMSGKNCELRLDYTASSIGSNVVVQIVQGSNIVASSSALSTASTARTVSVNAPCGNLSSATTIRVANSTGNSGTSALKVANVTYGLATNLSQVSQAQLVGTIKVTGCSAPFERIAASFGDNTTALTGCSYATTGSIQAPTSSPSQLGVRLVNQPPGEYVFVYTGFYGWGNSSTALPQFRFSDGTNVSREVASTSAGGGAIAMRVSEFSGSISYSSGISDSTVRIQAISDGVGSAIWYGTTGSPGVIKVYRFPSTSELAYRPDQVAWKVDANIGGAVVGLGTGAVSSYSEITSGSLTLTQNAGSIATQIACASGTASSGTTCTAANESVGVVFNVPTAGDVLACASFTHNGQGSGGEVITTFQIMETTNTSSAIVQEGKTRLVSGGGPTTILKNPLRVCGTFTFASAGQKTLRLQYEQAGSINVSEILADQNPAIGQPDIHWEVYPITQSIPAPLLVGSVTSNSAGLERIERAYVADGSTCPATVCTITSQSNWLNSVIKNSTGNYTLNITSGVFSGIPSCVIQHSQNETSIEPGASATQVNFTTKNASGTVTDASRVMILCQGPR